MAESTMQNTINEYKARFPGWPYVTAVQYVEALALTRQRAQRVRDAMEDRIHFGQVGLFSRDECEKGIEAMDSVIRHIDIYYLPQAKEVAEATPDKEFSFSWHSSKIVTNYPMVDEDTGEVSYFTPEYLAPDYFGFACAENDETLKKALAEFPSDLAESAKLVGFRLGQTAVVAAGIGLGVWAFKNVKSPSNKVEKL